jgi:6-phosphogluconolactonase
MSLVYISTYTKHESKGIYVCRFDPAHGRLSPARLAAETANPSFLALHPNRRFLYAVNEVSDLQGKAGGAVSAFKINPATGELAFLNQVASQGALPCHITLDASGQSALVANYKSGSVAVLPVRNDGRLEQASAMVQHAGSSVHPTRQRGPHAHSVILSPDNRFALVPDLGLDQVLAYRLDAAHGTLAPGQPPSTDLNAGAGPRHAAFHPNGRLLYVISELQSTLTVFAYDQASAALTRLQTLSTLPTSFSAESAAAEVRVHPAGRFLYASNRGHDSIAVFSIAPEEGTLTLLGHVPTQGKTPRHFALPPTSAWLVAANQDSNTLVVFRLDPKSGALNPTGQTIEVPSPVCVRFVTEPAALERSL